MTASTASRVLVLRAYGAQMEEPAASSEVMREMPAGFRLRASR